MASTVEKIASTWVYDEMVLSPMCLFKDGNSCYWRTARLYKHCLGHAIHIVLHAFVIPDSLYALALTKIFDSRAGQRGFRQWARVISAKKLFKPGRSLPQYHHNTLTRAEIDSSTLLLKSTSRQSCAVTRSVESYKVLIAVHPFQTLHRKSISC